MFFADLTPYEYGGQPQDNLLNVGWLSRDQPFSTGTPPDGFLQVLRRLVASPVNLYRGFHICEFCPDPPAGSTGHQSSTPPPGTFGNGEIRVSGVGGVIYVAPVLVAHYVEVHRYLPPATFIEAVLNVNQL